MKKILSLIMVMLLMFGAMPMSFAEQDDTNATIYISGDDQYDFYINGIKIPELSAADTEQPWKSYKSSRVKLVGDYSLAAKVEDTGGNIAGLAVAIVFDNNSVVNVHSIGWKHFIGEDPSTQEALWYSPEFDDSEWENPHVIEDGQRDQYWVKSYNDATLSWMWSEYYKVITDTRFDEVVYFRFNGNYTVEEEEEEEEGSNTDPSNNDPSNEDPEPEQPPTPTEPAGPQANVTVNYVDSEGNTLLPSFVFSGTVGTNYVTTARTVDGFELVETPSNASGSFVEGGVVINYVYSDGTEEVVEEDTPLGAPALDLDSIYVDEPTEEETTEAVEEVVLDEATPLADALPQTGQATPELFFGLGGLISTAGLMLKRKNK